MIGQFLISFNSSPYLGVRRGHVIQRIKLADNWLGVWCDGVFIDCFLILLRLINYKLVYLMIVFEDNCSDNVIRNVI